MIHMNRNKRVFMSREIFIARHFPLFPYSLEILPPLKSRASGVSYRIMQFNMI